MKNLLPGELPDGKSILEEGRKIGKSIKIGQNGFDLHRNQSFIEWYITEQASDNIILFPDLGLKNIDEQVEGLKLLYERSKVRGVELGMVYVTASLLNGIPFEAREKVPTGASYVYNGLEDYQRVATAAPIFVSFGDYAVGCPNSVENVCNALAAGCIGVGTLSQFAWKFPYWQDEISQITETVKSMGILAAKRDEFVGLGSYIGDGIGSGFIDHASMVGYTLVEQYVAEKLCGVSYSMGLGGLMPNIISKCATWLAINETCRLDEFSPVIAHYEGNTIEVTHDAAHNYALVVGDFIPFALLERKYKTGALYVPKPVTEAMRVPTVDEVVDVLIACQGVMVRIQEFEDAGLFDDTEILKQKDRLVKNGRQFFDNIMNGLLDLRVNIEDPVQILLALRRLGAAELERRYTPGEKNQALYRGFNPVMKTSCQYNHEETVRKTVSLLEAEGLAEAIRGKSIITAAADTHQYALFIISEVLTRVGARVINAGIDQDPEDILSIAKQENVRHIAISLHNGQCVDWVKTFIESKTADDQDFCLYVGGVLNTFIDSSSEPVDATELLTEAGAITCDNVIELVNAVIESDRSKVVTA